MGFKGTKGKWELTDNKRGVEVRTNQYAYKSICSSTGNTKWQYDMLLISKAPEMLEMLELTLKVWGCEYKGSPHYNKIEQLIKEATELK